MKKFKIEKIEKPHGPQDTNLIQRLYELGFHPGLEVEVVATVSFKSVIVVQFGATRIALNDEEFACLHGH